MPNERQFLRLYHAAKLVVDSDLDWDIKYELVFSEAVALTMQDLVPYDYCDPDMGYEDDVRAWMAAVTEVSDRVKAENELSESCAIY